MSWQAAAFVKDLTLDTGIDKIEKLVLFVLADYHQHETGVAFPGVRRLAREALCSMTTARRALRRAEEHGFVRYVSSWAGGKGKPLGGRGNATEYEFNFAWPKPWPAGPPDSTEKAVALTGFNNRKAVRADHKGGQGEHERRSGRAVKAVAAATAQQVLTSERSEQRARAHTREEDQNAEAREMRQAIREFETPKEGEDEYSRTCRIALARILKRRLGEGAR